MKRNDDEPTPEWVKWVAWWIVVKLVAIGVMSVCSESSAP